MWFLAVSCAVFGASTFSFEGIDAIMSEAECLTADGSAGRCLAPSECPPTYSRQKPVLCRYSRGYGMRICCSRSSYDHEDFYSDDQPIAFPTEFEQTPGYHHHKPSTNSYNNPFSGKDSPYRPNRPTNSYDRPLYEDNQGYNKPAYNQPSYNERPNTGLFGEQGYRPSSSEPSFGRPAYNEDDRPYNNRPNYGSSSSKPSFGRPNYNEESEYERPSYGNNNRPSSLEPSFGRPDYNRPDYDRPYNNRPSSTNPSFERPDYNENPDYDRPSYGQNNRPSSSEPSFGRPDYNRPDYEKPFNNRPSSSNPPFGRPDYNGESEYDGPSYGNRPSSSKPPYNNRPSQGRPRPDVWNSPDDSSQVYSNNRKTTPRPSWDLENNDNNFSSTRSRVSERKCEDYSQSVTETLHPLPLSIDSEVIPLKVQKCDFSAVKLIVGGEQAELGEFPHMAAIGFRTPRSEEVSWNCGGTLISEQYVLTAAHCVNTTYGKPTVVRLGEYNLERENDGAEPEDYRIEKIIPHPEYTKSRKYNDIALLRLSRPVRFNKWIRPACLSTDTRVQGSPTATGWGRTHFVGKLSDVLMKVNLNIVDNQQCNSIYRQSPGTASFTAGITDTMLCAGDMQGGRDTCLGDSGGPLSVTKADNPCVHYVVGVTSFGKICGAPQSPGVYTRVSKYVPWIERTVWPNS